MDESRFDKITRTLARGATRRSVVRGLGAAVLGAVGLTRLRPAAAGGNGPCALNCVALYAPGPDRAACIAAAAQGEGQCLSCTGSEDVCADRSGQVTYCTNFHTDPTNCGGCGRECYGEAAKCQGGRCSTDLLADGSICSADAECASGVCHSLYHFCYNRILCHLGGSSCARNEDCCFEQPNCSEFHFCFASTA